MEKKGVPMVRDWVVGVSLAALHPNYGEQSPEETLSEMKKEDSEGEVDVNMKAYIERKKLAYQSPYPTVVLEVKAVPPFEDFGASPSSQTQGSNDARSSDTANDINDMGKVSKEDVKKLEILFGKSAEILKSKKGKSKEDAFYDSIGKVDGIKEVMSDSSIVATQKWITLNDPSYRKEGTSFAVTDAKHVDSAYEVIFTNLSVQNRSMREKMEKDGAKSNSRYVRSNVIMPHFLSSSATSFEKFALEVSNIISKVKGLEGVSVDFFHPEHINVRRQSQLPVLVIECKQ